MQQYWLALTRVRGLGNIRLRQLRSHFETIEATWFASPEELYAIGVSKGIVEELVATRKQVNPLELLEVVEQLGAWVTTLDDGDYPPLLREIDDAPVVLYGRGTLLPEDQLAVAMVGTRRASSYGKEITKQLVQNLVDNQVTIVSGLAIGIDIYAHRAALDANGRTIAVLGSGIDVIYPSEHRDVAREIVQTGAIITEYPPATKPERGNFPMRNRIISGMTLGTVVVEAPDNSGALKTANLAGEQGRDVFAVPGNITSPNSRGTNRLIQDGAKLVMNGDDILKELNLLHRAANTRQTVQQVMPSNLLEEQILNFLMIEPRHVDEISRACELSVKDIQAALVIMELKGMVYQTAPMTYHVR